MYKIHNYRLLLLFSLIVLLAGCESETKMIDESIFGFDYFPVAIDDYRIFRIDSTIYDNDGLIVIEKRTFIEERITELFINGEGDTLYVLQRSARGSDNEEWRAVDNWLVGVSSENGYRIEENLKFIKMVFPLSVGTRWNGNQFNEFTEVTIAGETLQAYKHWDYEVLANNVNIDVNGTSYSNVFQIQQADDDIGIERRLSHEWYAPGIGMIRKYMEILDTQCTSACDGQTWAQKAERGYIVEQVLIDHN